MPDWCLLGSHFAYKNHPNASFLVTESTKYMVFREFANVRNCKLQSSLLIFSLANLHWKLSSLKNTINTRDFIKLCHCLTCQDVICYWLPKLSIGQTRNSLNAVLRSLSVTPTTPRSSGGRGSHVNNNPENSLLLHKRWVGKRQCWARHDGACL